MAKRDHTRRHAHHLCPSHPLFHNAKLHQDTSFAGVVWPKARASDAAARAYRTLKLAFAQQQATRQEQLFFRKEMEVEALLAQPLCGMADDQKEAKDQ